MPLVLAAELAVLIFLLRCLLLPQFLVAAAWISLLTAFGVASLVSSWLPRHHGGGAPGHGDHERGHQRRGTRPGCHLRRAGRDAPASLRSAASSASAS
ncbi:hypothetical protein ACIF8W_18130 [Streptomyces sp. NPDC085639]|uniref:hypothetical protein n=1 Tax=Streptomyces sp. NPDC085639 TaxID=3365734 RepID=UPI0037CDCA47